MKYLVFALTILVSPLSLATEVLNWTGKPLKVELAVGQERLIKFSDNVEVAIPKSLVSRLLLPSAQGVVYAKATDKILDSRIRFRLMESKRVILIDFVTVESSEQLGDVIIQLGSDKPQASTQTSRNKGSIHASRVSAVDLIRYASISLYMPERLIPTGKGITETKVPLNLNLEHFFIGSSYGVFNLDVIKGWRAGGLYLTAIHLKNRTSSIQTIRRQDINSDWLYFTPQQLFVTGKGSERDQTTIYIVTEKPIQKSLYLSRGAYGSVSK
ncbi:TIGR03749 family integrating conjugative element protein [Shewanella sp. MBTL60-007]|uniref:TIGR03749 family integrating conjugative element protein n=1 Tax=Shewanella sp. MBTL60-007 TaxID=2815911 RepID=UPI001BC221E3|nr:TIGR03749 family integrating conjugative element protein [Shewanella sp. MBTL60-007]GIU20881.1 integrating conjugative element protein [Shewanella sp. MBTL60-007]